MDWRRLFLEFDGRISRQPFWIGTLAVFGANVLVGALLGRGALGAIVSLALLYPSIAVAVKRWHDRGKSGWWVLIGVIPVIGWIWTLIECGLLPGTPGANEYGPDPLSGESAVA
jgi:uncharacterized membrane protein YhaH (DUF805 family)